MRLRSIDNKRITDNQLRITEPTVIFSDSVKVIATHEVTVDEIGRPDLISLQYYNSPDYLDIILKFNNISNPFSITEGDVLDIPDHLAIGKKFTPIKEITGEVKDDNKIRDQFLNSKRLTTKDVNRVDYLKRKAAQKKNGSSQPLPPNILKDGDKNINIDGDTIIV